MERVYKTILRGFSRCLRRVLRPTGSYNRNWTANDWMTHVAAVLGMYKIIPSEKELAIVTIMTFSSLAPSNIGKKVGDPAFLRKLGRTTAERNHSLFLAKKFT